MFNNKVLISAPSWRIRSGMSITGELNGTDLSTLGNDAGTFYDRIARLHTLVFKFNGYGRSLERYFRENPLPLSTGA